MPDEHYRKAEQHFYNMVRFWKEFPHNEIINIDKAYYHFTVDKDDKECYSVSVYKEVMNG